MFSAMGAFADGPTNSADKREPAHATHPRAFDREDFLAEEATMGMGTPPAAVHGAPEQRSASSAKLVPPAQHRGLVILGVLATVGAARLF